MLYVALDPLAIFPSTESAGRDSERAGMQRMRRKAGGRACVKLAQHEEDTIDPMLDRSRAADQSPLG